MRKNFFKKIFCFIFVFALAIFSFSALSLNRNFESHANAETSNSVSASTTLSGASKHLYDFLVPKFQSVAKGEVEKTTFSIDKTTLESWGVKYSWTNTELGKSSIVEDDVDTIKTPFFNQFNFSLVTNTILLDLPFECYWFDKTEGYGSTFSAEYTSKKITITEYSVYFRVTKDYMSSTYDENNPAVDTSKTALTSSVLTNAKAIVETNKTLSDYKKLLAYKNTICNLVTYDDEAADDDYTGGYGNQWQVINVFDNNPLTNVVCEGYAKAFQLLCNLSTFESSLIKCYTITGDMVGGTGAGGHMWNIVTMDDLNSYMVDVTNSDTGSVGQDGELFLAGNSTGTIDGGYLFALSPTVSFTYDANAKTIWGTDSSSILKLASSTYEEERTEIVVEENQKTYNKQPITVVYGTDIGSANICFKLDSKVLTPQNYNWSITYFNDNNNSVGNELAAAPTNAGTYWIKAVATKNDFSDQAVKYFKFIIKKATLSITSVTASGKVYNELSTVSLSDIKISGAFDGDDVSLLPANVTANLSSADVGEYDKVNLSNFILSGADKNNYEIQNINDVNLSTKIEITKASITTTETFQVVTGEGMTLADVEIEITAKNSAGNEISGTFVWVDDNGNVLDSSTVITKWTVYKYIFTPDNLNYESCEGDVALWIDIETEFNLIKFIKDNASKFAFGAAIVAAIFIGIARHKRRKRRREGAV